MATPDITVLIPAYDSMPYFERTLESLTTQTIAAEQLEVIIVDNGSTDGTLERAREYAGRAPHGWRVVEQEPSGGPAHGRNLGIAQARGRYLFFLDSDDYLEPQALERMVAHADAWASDVLLFSTARDGRHPYPYRIFADSRPQVERHRDPQAFVDLLSVSDAFRCYRTDFLRQRGLAFREGCGSEDCIFAWQAELQAGRLSVAADYPYLHVVNRAGNSSRSFDHTSVVYSTAGIEQETRAFAETFATLLPAPVASDSLYNLMLCKYDAILGILLRNRKVYAPESTRALYRLLRAALLQIWDPSRLDVRGYLTLPNAAFLQALADGRSLATIAAIRKQAFSLTVKAIKGSAPRDLSLDLELLTACVGGAAALRPRLILAPKGAPIRCHAERYGFDTQVVSTAAATIGHAGYQLPALRQRLHVSLDPQTAQRLESDDYPTSNWRLSLWLECTQTAVALPDGAVDPNLLAQSL